jgi:maltose O-acetyltransferase
MGRIQKNLRQLSRDVLLNGIVNGPALPQFLRVYAWNRVGHDLDPTAVISPGCFLSDRRGLTVGPRTFINYNCYFDLDASITIGRDVQVGYDVAFVTGSHRFGDGRQRAGEHAPEPIVVEDAVWIGARSTLLGGIVIGEGCVIAAGAVVTRDCEPNGLYAGVPAVRKRDL